MDDRSRGADRVAALERYAIMDTPAEQAFDDIVALAAQCCAAPVALVSLLDAERQWFKARIGFDEPETPIGEAVCALTLDAPDLLIIPDLNDDARTEGNPLVARAGARFYAGVPLRIGGVAVGSLCVLDTQPRPDGLGDEQAEALRRLGRQVEAQLELRRLITERSGEVEAGRIAHAALSGEQAELTASERHWRGLFEKLSDGFVVGELIRGPDGRATDWRILDVNAAWGALMGQAPEAAIGRTLREAIPETQDAWIADVATVVDTRTPRTFHRTMGTPVRQYEGHAFHLDDDRFAIVLVEITDRQRTAARQAALLALGDRLRDLHDIGEMTREAARLVGNAMGVIRAGFGRIDVAAGTVAVEPDWTAPGVASVEGVHRFADYGRLLDDLLEGRPLVINDVDADTHIVDDPGALRRLGIRSLINMPVREREGTVAVFIVHDRDPRTWTADELAFLRDVADRVQAAVARLRAEQRQTVLNGELSHRMKNMLALVQAIATQTLRRSTDREALGSFERRLGALSSAHDVLLGKGWAAADLEAVARKVLGVIAPDRVRIEGPDVEMGARAAVSLSLVLHELCTNAAKYGALSVEGGQVAVTWTIDADDVLTLDWRESGGPPPRPPERRGFGSRLINMGLTGTGGVDVGYAQLGFFATMRARVAELQSA